MPGVCPERGATIAALFKGKGLSMATTESTTSQPDKVSLPTLTAMVVGSMIGSGSSCFRGASVSRPVWPAPSSPGPSPAPEC